MNTPIGVLRCTRLPFGIKIASAQFQSAIEKTIGESPHSIIYQDDICLGGCDEKELNDRIEFMLQRLGKSGIKINKAKSVLQAKEITFLGYSISGAGVKPNKRSVDKILAVKAPSVKRI